MEDANEPVVNEWAIDRRTNEACQLLSGNKEEGYICKFGKKRKTVHRVDLDTTTLQGAPPSTAMKSLLRNLRARTPAGDEGGDDGGDDGGDLEGQQQHQHQQHQMLK
jgi:hypothetical protein